VHRRLWLSPQRLQQRRQPLLAGGRAGDNKELDSGEKIKCRGMRSAGIERE
jgi:hypothetical protein